MSLFKQSKSKQVNPTQKTAKAATVKAVPKKAVIQKNNLVKSNKLKINKGQISYNVLLHPLMTEKINLQMSYNQYVFAINPRTNKVEVKKAIQESYGIIPTKVKVMNVVGKAVRSGKGKHTYRKNWKKAIVTLPAGKKIDIYE